VKRWILTANPGTYRIFEALRIGYPITYWRIAQLRHEIVPGDEFALWASGDESVRGVYALGVVTMSAVDGLVDPDPYWVNPADANEPMLSVGIRIDDNLIDSPILKTELADDPRFAGALVLRMPGGKKPFRVTDAQWQAILSRHARRTGIARRTVGMERPPIEYEVTFRGTTVGRVRRAAVGSRSWWAHPSDARPWERFPVRAQAEMYLAAPHRQLSGETGFGQAFRKANEAASSAPKDPFIVDPDLVNRGNRGHAQTLNALADFLDARGVQPLGPGPGDPLFDIGWTRGAARFVAEVKSLTENNEEHQLRLGLGQVLRYQHALLGRFHPVHAVLVVEREPGDSAWKKLCRSHEVRLLWPPDFVGLLEDLSPPNRVRRRR
jgi:hypothetical protein